MENNLFNKLQECKECRFHDWEVNVWNEEKGYGKYGAFTYSDKPTVMIVGQNPSHRRFPAPLNHSLSGHQGDIFRNIFGKENLILTNLVRISTPDNKITIEDAKHGWKHTYEEIMFFMPKLVIALGRFCKEVIPPASISKIVYFKHPDYYQTYNKSGLEEYIKSIKEIKQKYT